jgi:cytidyltransferase-like protein
MKVLYAGSFNPWHKGHQYVYNCACEYFGKDNVIIGIGNNPAKQKTTSAEFIKWTMTVRDFIYFY